MYRYPKNSETKFEDYLLKFKNMIMICGGNLDLMKSNELLIDYTDVINNSKFSIANKINYISYKNQQKNPK